MDEGTVTWLLQAGEPWTRYRTMVDLLSRAAEDALVAAARAELIAHPQVRALVAGLSTWGQSALTRHNDAAHPLHKLSTLADFGVRPTDAGLGAVVEEIMASQDTGGPLRTLLRVSAAFGGTGEDCWSWMLCDAPTLLYALLAMGLGDDPRLQRAAQHLAGLSGERGWGCVVAPELGHFRGPGRKADPCPLANLLVLKALSLAPAWRDSAPIRAGAEVLLKHWESRATTRPYLFGIGTDFRKVKYPFVWYDLLHVVEVLSRFPFLHADMRFQEMLVSLTSQADATGRFRAGSMYRSWQGWSFADKKSASPWLSFLVARIVQRVVGAH
jgi:hypothetical protein